MATTGMLTAAQISFKVAKDTASASVFVEVGKTSMTIHASIIVDRDSLKRIIIGAKGNMIKQIGIKARIDLENLVEKKVYLDLQVRTIKKWRDKEEYLSEFGFRDFE